MSRDSRIRILVVGQTPPPHHGQAIMIQHLLDGQYSGYELLHQRMAFSRTADEVGGFRLRKLIELLRVIVGIVVKRLRYGPHILFYPPAGPNAVPLLRDLMILGSTRWMFRATIFHFHAGGIGAYVGGLPPLARRLCRQAYGKADAGIRISSFAAPDPELLEAKREFIVPNAVRDHSTSYTGSPPDDDTVEFLFVGLVCEEKGVEVLLEACEILKKVDIRFSVTVVGPVVSPEYEQLLERIVVARGLRDIVRFTGERSGEEKWKTFAAADVFCFPTHHRWETFGIVLLEAMSFGLPVIATRWRGTQDIVVDGTSGFLVPVRDAASLASKMEVLLRDPALRREMGRSGRDRFLEHFTLDGYYEAMTGVFDATVATD